MAKPQRQCGWLGRLVGWLPNALTQSFNWVDGGWMVVNNVCIVSTHWGQQDYQQQQQQPHRRYSYMTEYFCQERVRLIKSSLLLAFTMAIPYPNLFACHTHSINTSSRFFPTYIPHTILDIMWTAQGTYRRIVGWGVNCEWLWKCHCDCCHGWLYNCHRRFCLPWQMEEV